MGKMIDILNLGHIDQHIGSTKIPPQRWTPVPDALAIQLAGDLDYRCDSDDLLGEYLFAKDDLIHLGWSSPLWYVDGYGSVGQEIANAFLQMAGVKLTIALRDYHPALGKCGGLPLERWGEAFVPQSIIDRLREDQEKPIYGINMTFPGDCHRSAFPRTIAYTMFESTATPMEWTKPMNLCRRIMTPCENSAQSFRVRGVTVPIHIVPQGVNPEVWPYVDRSKRDGPFTFLIAGGLTYRKNPIGAVRAFLAAFPHDRDVRLVIKTRAGQIEGGFKNWIDRVPKDDRIQIIAENSTPKRMVQYFLDADAFVWPSRGEGFGIPPVEAMSTGLPVIASDNSGMSQYCDSRYNYPIPCKEVKVPNQANGGFPDRWGDCGNWWEPDFDALVESLRDVRNNRKRALAKGKSAAAWVREKWTIMHTCQKILEVVCDDARESGLPCLE